MTRPINEDVISYKDDFFKGLSLRETGYSVAAVFLGAVVVLFFGFYLGINLNVAVTLAIPLVGVVGAAGFYQKNGMTLQQLVKKYLHILFQKPLVFQSIYDCSETKTEPFGVKSPKKGDLQ